MNITIEKLIYGGEGLAHHDGATVFVPFVLPGEAVEVEAVERKKKFVRARVRSLVKSSPERAVPACKHFGSCGGCHYQHIPYAAQLGYKTEILRETLRRIGRIEWTGPITTHASPPWGYRNRAQWKIRPLGESLSATPGQERLGIGYFRAASTALCAVEECPILSPLLAETLGLLRGALAKGELPAGTRQIEAFADAPDTKLLLNVSFARFPASPAKLAEIFRRLVPGLESLLLSETSRDGMELDGPGYLFYSAAGASYRVGHLSFFQVNRFLVEEMALAVADKGGLALDLYAGVGLYTLPLARTFERVVAVEANPASARDLEVNIAASPKANGGRAEPHCADVEEFLKIWKESPDLVVVDPPRAGVSPGALARLGELAPARITYVSCEPSTLARDLAALAGAGYALAEVHLFDLFPETFHIESLVKLTRRA